MKIQTMLLSMCSCILATGFVDAQPPGGRERGPSSGDANSFTARLMAFDEDKDGKLTKAELTDERLQPLFARIDGNNDGVATKEEMTAFFAKESATLGAGGRGGPQGGPGGFGPPGGGPNGPGGGMRRGGGPNGMPGPSQAGQIMPNFLQESLQLTASQRKQLDKLQQDVDARLSKILNDEQKQRLNEMRDRGPGGFGPPGGSGNGPGGPQRGPGGPNGPPQP